LVAVLQEKAGQRFQIVLVIPEVFEMINEKNGGRSPFDGTRIAEKVKRILRKIGCRDVCDSGSAGTRANPVDDGVEEVRFSRTFFTEEHSRLGVDGPRFSNIEAPFKGLTVALPHLKIPKTALLHDSNSRNCPDFGNIGSRRLGPAAGSV
jgi:hypothetical protein